MESKVIDVKTAIDKVKSGDTVLVGGFGGSGAAFTLLHELEKRDLTNLTSVSEDGGYANAKLKNACPGLLDKGIITHIKVSFLGSNATVHSNINKGTLTYELIPQGTLAERLRAAGSGIAGFYTPTGVGTVVEEGKERRTIDGKEYILEKALHGDIALVKCFRADTMGNAVFKYSAMNFNPLMAMAAKMVILEAEEIVEPGEIEADQVQLPGVFVDHVVQSMEV